MGVQRVHALLLAPYIIPAIILSFVIVRSFQSRKSNTLIYLQLKLHQGLRGPLQHLPGPRYSLWTRLPLKYAILQGERVRYVHSLHQRYGIAPEDLFFKQI